jgi:cytochrome b561
LFALICLHVGAALLHRFVLRDRVVQRMALW